jgi:hypothetical protein
MKKLERSDFKKEFVGNIPYLSWKGKNCEICIESGFGCLDIAVYDLRQELLEPKVTINTSVVSAIGIIKYFKKLDKTVNNFYQKWEIKK